MIRPFVPAKDYDQSRRFYEALGFVARFATDRITVMAHGDDGFLLQNFYQKDLNLRESTVLGLVGAGGIGIILQGAIDTFRQIEEGSVPQPTLVVEPEADGPNLLRLQCPFGTNGCVRHSMPCVRWRADRMANVPLSFSYGQDGR
ncbi:catechol 2,3-dioxygenase-like lactoylglutathione lyase family enzyme [Aurantimonas endophytica]|uniref:Catechol 2,3-dioxygenase-like lactoylglutathione lyase family enzyme n=1 Tax=Aurantimonas endophytica TaxID=1522175 RepID=A0A7W6HGL5_9HYPH|nr:catechol 2,3-dioxygenase-like lactoylglutathione lyase family enzyme [Aurantimonas endophytica]